MMRDIRFRIWNKEDMVMVNKPNTVRLIDGKLLCDPEDTLMQYTGLKDKNGTEIYEGDILKIERFKRITIKTVDDIRETFTTNSAAYNSFAYHCDSYPYDKQNEESDATVIGNIYENPELLEE